MWLSERYTFSRGRSFDPESLLRSRWCILRRVLSFELSGIMFSAFASHRPWQRDQKIKFRGTVN